MKAPRPGRSDLRRVPFAMAVLVLVAGCDSPGRGSVAAVEHLATGDVPDPNPPEIRAP